MTRPSLPGLTSETLASLNFSLKVASWRTRTTSSTLSSLCPSCHFLLYNKEGANNSIQCFRITPWWNWSGCIWIEEASDNLLSTHWDWKQKLSPTTDSWEWEHWFQIRWQQPKWTFVHMLAAPVQTVKNSGTESLWLCIAMNMALLTVLTRLHCSLLPRSSAVPMIPSIPFSHPDFSMAFWRSTLASTSYEPGVTVKFLEPTSNSHKLSQNQHETVSIISKNNLHVYITCHHICEKIYIIKSVLTKDSTRETMSNPTVLERYFEPLPFQRIRITFFLVTTWISELPPNLVLSSVDRTSWIVLGWSFRHFLSGKCFNSIVQIFGIK